MFKKGGWPTSFDQFLEEDQLFQIAGKCTGHHTGAEDLFMLTIKNSKNISILIPILFRSYLQ